MPQYYRIIDPLENFKIRLTIREVHRSRVDNNNNNGLDDDDDEQFEQDIEIGWQEKLYSPIDIADYLKHGNDKRGSQAELDTRRQLAILDQKDPGSVKKMRKRTIIYTYIDRDQIQSELTPVLRGNPWAEPYLASINRNQLRQPPRNQTLEAADDDGIDDDFDLDDIIPDFNERMKKLSKRFKPPKFCKSMTICMATDVNYDKLGSNRFFWQQKHAVDEFRLCTLRVYEGGLLVVDPGFSTIIEEVAIGTGTRSGKNIFMSTETVLAGITKGFRLSTQSIMSKSGSEYEYALQNVNELNTPDEIEEALKEQDEPFKLNQGVWKQDPPHEGSSHTCTYYINIDKAIDFDGDNVLVVYQVKVPSGWKLRVGNLVDAAAEVDLKNAGASDLLDNDGYLDGAEAAGMLRGISQLASNLSEGSSSRSMGVRTYLEKLDEPTRVVLGFFIMLFTAIAITLGPAYPFWILPCLSLLFVVGTGLPASPNHKIIIKKQKTGNITKLKAIPAPTLTPPVAHIGHMINLSFDVTAPINSTDYDTPTIVFQVYQMGFMDRMKVQGYGYMKLPENPGIIKESVSCWRPLGDISQRLMEFFVGGMNTLQDPYYVSGVPTKLGDNSSPNKYYDDINVINRFGVQSEGSGQLEIDISTLVLDPKQAKEDKEEEGDDKKAAYLQRTVDHLINEHRQSRGNGLPPLNSTAPLNNKSSSSKTDRISGSLAKTLGADSTARAEARRQTRNGVSRFKAGRNSSKNLDSEGGESDTQKGWSGGSGSESENESSSDRRSLLRAKLKAVKE